MLKKLTTYSLTLFLFFTIAMPTYFCLVEESFEISLVTELADDEEKQEKKSIEDSEIKTYYVVDAIYLFKFTKNNKVIVLIKEIYLNYCDNLDTPPPEFLA